MARITQKELVVRYLASKKGEWVYGYEIVQKASSMIGGTHLIQDADTRAHSLARDGHYDSENFRYTIQHRKIGKYAEFRAIKQPLPSLSNDALLAWFDSLPVHA